jgi:hypothetical protein
MDVVWTLMRGWADRPELVLGLFIVVCLLNLLDWRRTWSQGLRFPTVLFLLRTIGLYLPVSGTISSADRVVFWSGEAYFYFIPIFVLLGIIIFYARAVKNNPLSNGVEPEDAVPLALRAFLSIITYLFLLLLSSICLPVDGLSHLYMPALSVLFSFKVLLVSPLLLPLAWVTLVIQVGLIVISCHRAAREINKLMLVILVLGGLIQFGYQPLNLAFSSEVTAIRDNWKTTGSASKPYPGPDEEMTDFIQTWRRQIPRTAAWGVNLIERELPQSSSGPLKSLPEETMKKQLDSIPDVYDFLTFARVRKILPVSALVLLLIALAELLRYGDEQQTTLGQRTPEHERLS